MEWLIGTLLGLTIGYVTRPAVRHWVDKRKKRNTTLSLRPLSDESNGTLRAIGTLAEKVLSAFEGDDSWCEEHDRVRSFLAGQMSQMSALLRHKENLEQERDSLGLSVKKQKESEAEQAAREDIGAAINRVREHINAIFNAMDELYGAILTARSATAVGVNCVSAPDYNVEVKRIKSLLAAKSKMLIGSHVEAQPKTAEDRFTDQLNESSATDAAADVLS